MRILSTPVLLALPQLRLLAPSLLATLLLIGVAQPAAAQVNPPTSIQATVRPGWLVFKVKPALKNRLHATTIEDAALNQALATVGATGLTQKFPRAVAPPAEPRPGQEPGVDLTLVYQVRYDPARWTLAKAQRLLLASGALAYVEPVRDYPVLYEPNDPLADSVTGTQYHLKNIRAYRGWDIEQGDSSEVIGVIDTGTRFTHRDMQGSVAYNYGDPINGLDDDNDGYVDNFRGWDTADDDNLPSLDAPISQPAHGGVVASTLAARTNNGLGGAGVAHSCRYLPVKIYGSTAAGKAFAGYEGIIYAADHGCHVINCSWGGPDSYSQFEQDVITYASVNRNAIVVAAAGNTNADLDFYPASYKGVLSVASLERTDVKGASNTYSYRISLSAPGRQIITANSLDDSTYISVSGSSFASPMVAGTAALVRHHFPALTAAQVAERVRVTADTSIYSLSGNANFREKLGRGRVNMRRALADPDVRSVRVVATRFATRTGAGPYYGGDTVTVEADFLNYLTPLQGLTVTLTSPSAQVQVLAGSYVAGPLGTLALATNGGANRFRIVLAAAAPLNTVVPLRFGFRDLSGYRDYQYVKLEVNPSYVTLDANRLDVTVTSRGNLAFDNGNLTRGRGVRFDRSGLLLAEGGLLVGRDAARVSDMVRSATAGVPDQDFTATTPIRFQRPPTLSFANQEAANAFQDAATAAQANVKVEQRAWASTAPGYDSFVFLEYDVINRDAATLTTGYAGLFADWDIHPFEHNRTAWDNTRRLAYAHALAPNDTVYTGLKLLTTGGAAHFYALDQLNAAAPGPVNATNGLTPAEKYAALQAAAGAPQTAGTGSTGTDVGQVISQSLPPLATGDTAHVAFVVLAGRTLAALQAAADSAQALYDLQHSAAPAAPTVTGAARCGTGSLTLTASGAPAGATYRWYTQPNGGQPISGQTGATYTTPSLSGTTTYYVSVRSAGGQESGRVAVVATVNTLPVAQLTADGPTTFCQGDSVVFTASGGIAYQFLRNGQPVSGTTTTSLTVLTAGIYSLIVTNAAGCVDTSASVSVVVNAVPSAAFAYGAASYCLNAAANPSPTISGAPGGSFSAPAGLAVDPQSGALDLAASTAGTYLITYTVGSPCPASQTRSVTLNAAPTPGISASGPTTFCEGDSVVLTATGGASFLWNTGQSATSITVKTSGSYSVTATNAANCQATSAPLTVTVNPTPTATFSYPVSTYCAGSGQQPAPLVTGAPGGTFAATPAGLTINATTGVLNLGASAAGTYTVSYSIAGACPASETQTVTVGAAPTASVSAGGATTFCQGDSVELRASGGTSYLWSNGLSTPVITVGTAGSYTVTATSAGGCSATSAPLVVTVNPLPNAPTLTATPQANGAVLLTSSGGATTQFYLNGVLIPGAVGPTYLVTSPGQAGVYTATVSSAAGCVSADSAPLPVMLTGINSPSAIAFGFNLFPNPTTANKAPTLVLIGGPLAATVTIFNSLGQQVFTSAVPATSFLTLPLLPAGAYTVRVSSVRGTLVKSLVSE